MIAAIGALALAAVLALVLALVIPGGGEGPAPASPTRPPGPPSSTGGPLRAGPPALPAPATEQLGANVGVLFNSMNYTQAQIDAQLAALAHTGATLIRSDALWEATEPAPPVNGVPHYDWRFDDRIAASLAAYRLHWLPIIDYSPRWARSVPGAEHSPPTSQVDYAAYAAAVAARYGVGGAFWRLHPHLPPEPVETYSIWNEPDTKFFWQPHPDPAAYARLYLRARVAITSVQPRARVIIGGLAHPARFLPALLAAAPRLRGHLDGVEIHPYGGNPFAVLARVREARLALRSLGLTNVPLYVTEFGWTTQPPGAMNYVPASLRPQFIFDTIAALRHTDCGLAAVLLYAWFTPERDPKNAQDWFGIDPANARPGPAVDAFTRALGAAGGTSSSTARLCAAG